MSTNGPEFNLTPEHWAAAKAYFEANKDEEFKCIKMRRKDNLDLINTHSFIKIEDVIYAMNNQHRYLGVGAFGKVKTIINEQGQYFALKIEDGSIPDPSEYSDSDSENSDSDSDIVDEDFPKTEPYHIMKSMGYLKGYVLRELPNLEYLSLADEDVPVTHKRYSVYAYIKGHDLSHWIEGVDFKKNPLSPLSDIQKLVICIKAALALQKMHEKGFLHRDIKPENIMVDIDPQNNQRIDVTLIDFDMSMILKRRQQFRLGYTQGTGDFMSPEVYGQTFSRYSHQSDIYALGKTFHELFGNDSLMRRNMTLRSMINKEHAIRPNLPKVIVTLFQMLKNKLQNTTSNNNLLNTLEKKLHRYLPNPASEMRKRVLFAMHYQLDAQRRKTQCQANVAHYVSALHTIKKQRI